VTCWGEKGKRSPYRGRLGKSHFGTREQSSHVLIYKGVYAGGLNMCAGSYERANTQTYFRIDKEDLCCCSSRTCCFVFMGNVP